MAPDKWITEFCLALRELRPEFGLKYAASIGYTWFGAYGYMDPDVAARRWALENGAKPVKGLPPVSHGEGMGRQNQRGSG